MPHTPQAHRRKRSTLRFGPPVQRPILLSIGCWVLKIVWALHELPILRADTIDNLPYRIRTHNYDGSGTTATGDIRTVGMAGATMGLADTFIAALDNPAGLTMSLNGADSNFASGTIYNGAIQDYQNPMHYYNFGVAVNAYPMGFSLGYVVPNQQGQSYRLQSIPGQSQVVNLIVKTYEFHLSYSHVLFDDRLALGASLILGQGQTELDFGGNNQVLDQGYFSYALGLNVGASYQLPYHLILGLSYATPMHYPGSPDHYQSPYLPGYFQQIETPGRLGLGLGFIPNRFIRADFTTFMIQSTDNAALLGDDSIPIGRYVTLQPRIGVAYNFWDEMEFRGTLFLGSYLEFSRVSDIKAKFHKTGGIEFKLWIFNVGSAIDSAPEYRNFILSAGIDIFKAMEKLEIIPTQPRPSLGHFLPNPLQISDEGLPRTLVTDWGEHQDEAPLNPVEVGLRIPERIGERATQISSQVSELLSPDSAGGEAAVAEKLSPPPSKPKGVMRRKKKAGRSHLKPASTQPSE